MESPRTGKGNIVTISDDDIIRERWIDGEDDRDTAVADPDRTDDTHDA